jgi:hypothetical protein
LLEYVGFSSALPSITNQFDELQIVTFIYLPHAMFVTFWQYIPSVEDTVLGIVVDTKPDVSLHSPLQVLSSLPLVI